MPVSAKSGFEPAALTVIKGLFMVVFDERSDEVRSYPAGQRGADPSERQRRQESYTSCIHVPLSLPHETSMKHAVKRPHTLRENIGSIMHPMRPLLGAKLLAAWSSMTEASQSVADSWSTDCPSALNIQREHDRTLLVKMAARIALGRTQSHERRL
jgi:hypothetical protein